MALNSKTFANQLAVLITAAGSLWIATTTMVRAAEIFRAHYEIRVATNGTDNTVRSTFETKPGEPFTLNLPPNEVALEVRRLAGEQYELQVTVKPTKQQGPALFSHTYQGILGRPLELRNDAAAVKLDGAISVVVLAR
jgi:hypothetical protein